MVWKINRIKPIQPSQLIGENYNSGSFKDQLKEIFSSHFLRFLMIPGIVDSRLEKRARELNKNKPLNRVFRKLITPLTIFGLILLFIITTCAVFAHWILFLWPPFRSIAYW